MKAGKRHQGRVSSSSSASEKGAEGEKVRGKKESKKGEQIAIWRGTRWWDHEGWVPRAEVSLSSAKKGKGSPDFDSQSGLGARKARSSKKVPIAVIEAVSRTILPRRRYYPVE